MELMKDEPYKIELIGELPEDEAITFYKQGDFVDLCAGPHLERYRKLRHSSCLALQALTGAETKKQMLQRIYGTSFTNREDLDAYITALEEAKSATITSLAESLSFLQPASI